MMQDESVAQQRHEQRQDQQQQQQQQQQRYYVPMPMVPTPFGYVPFGTGSPVSQGSPMGTPMGSPMGSQGTPMAMVPMANTPAGMTMMQAVPVMPNGDSSTPTARPMQHMVSPASPQGMMMMQPMANANGES